MVEIRMSYPTSTRMRTLSAKSFLGFSFFIRASITAHYAKSTKDSLPEAVFDFIIYAPRLLRTSEIDKMIVLLIILGGVRGNRRRPGA